MLKGKSTDYLLCFCNFHPCLVIMPEDLSWPQVTKKCISSLYSQQTDDFRISNMECWVMFDCSMSSTRSTSGNGISIGFYTKWCIFYCMYHSMYYHKLCLTDTMKNYTLPFARKHNNDTKPVHKWAATLSRRLHIPWINHDNKEIHTWSCSKRAIRLPQHDSPALVASLLWNRGAFSKHQLLEK